MTTIFNFIKLWLLLLYYNVFVLANCFLISKTRRKVLIFTKFGFKRFIKYLLSSMSSSTNGPQSYIDIEIYSLRYFYNKFNLSSIRFLLSSLSLFTISSTSYIIIKIFCGHKRYTRFKSFRAWRNNFTIPSLKYILSSPSCSTSSSAPLVRCNLTASQEYSIRHPDSLVSCRYLADLIFYMKMIRICLWLNSRLKLNFASIPPTLKIYNSSLSSYSSNYNRIGIYSALSSSLELLFTDNKINRFFSGLLFSRLFGHFFSSSIHLLYNQLYSDFWLKIFYFLVSGDYFKYFNLYALTFNSSFWPILWQHLSLPSDYNLVVKRIKIPKSNGKSRPLTYYTPCAWYKVKFYCNLYSLWSKLFKEFYDQICWSLGVINLSWIGLNGSLFYINHLYFKYSQLHGYLPSYISIDINSFFDNVKFSPSSSHPLYCYASFTQSSLAVKQGLHLSSDISTGVLINSLLSFKRMLGIPFNQILFIVYIDNILILNFSTLSDSDLLSLLSRHLATYNLSFKEDLNTFCSASFTLGSDLSNGRITTSRIKDNSLIFWKEYSSLIFNYFYTREVSNFMLLLNGTKEQSVETRSIYNTFGLRNSSVSIAEVFSEGINSQSNIKSVPKSGLNKKSLLIS